MPSRSENIPGIGSKPDSGGRIPQSPQSPRGPILPEDVQARSRTQGRQQVHEVTAAPGGDQTKVQLLPMRARAATSTSPEKETTIPHSAENEAKPDTTTLMQAYHDEITASNGYPVGCGDVAMTMASALTDTGNRPYILELVGEDGAPLVPTALGGEVKWQVHMVAGAGNALFDPVLPSPIRPEEYFADFFTQTPKISDVITGERLEAELAAFNNRQRPQPSSQAE